MHHLTYPPTHPLKLQCTDVRGGFICEEMGMGKTVITLSLILANPAPMKGPDLTAQAASDHWGTFCPGQPGVTATIAAMPKSRGTLVVSYLDNPIFPTHPRPYLIRLHL